jgi:5-deoxy-glucuronate isomerase
MRISMNTDPQCRLLVHPVDDGSCTYQQITANDAGWTHLNFGAKRLVRGARWQHNTGVHEMCVVLLGGRFSLISRWGTWKTAGARRDVFSGFPHAAYLPPHTEFELTAESERLDIAFGYTPGDPLRAGFFVTPLDVQNHGIELRGGDNASRQINAILPPGSPCHRLVCVEVYTPSGNWSSFPAHKHDARTVNDRQNLVEACLDEVYFYKFDKPQGFALQKIYTADRQLNEIAEPHADDVVLVPRGYHPVVAGHGYNAYYLNFLAGSDQSLVNTDDPDHKWIYGTWKGMDPRLPLVTLEMNNEAEQHEEL